MLRCMFCLATLSLIFTDTQPNRAEAQTPGQYEADGIVVAAASAAEPGIKLSLNRAAQYLDQGAIAWTRQKKCVSCHTNGTYLFIRPALTKALGPPSDAIRQFAVNQLKTLSEADTRKLRRSGTRPAEAIYIAAGLAEWDAHVRQKLSVETDQALRLMFKLQNSTGTWHALTCWPPFESSAYQEAHMAAMAVAAAPGWLNSLDQDDELQQNISRLKTYLRQSEIPHDYARVLQLWTSLRLDGILNSDEQQKIVNRIRGLQQADGGWSLRAFATPEQWGGGNRAGKLRAESNFEKPDSDGHMTGLCLLVLQEAGVASNGRQIQQGLDWLRKNQRQSGRWWTRSLNTDKWHFITYSGTAYPLLALQRAEDSSPATGTD